MIKSNTTPVESINLALKARDLKLAQSLLNETDGSLPDVPKSILQTRIHLASDQPEKAIGALNAISGDTSETPNLA